MTAACEPPERPGGGGNYAVEVAVMMELMTMAMACELAPVVSMQWGTGQAYTRHSWLGTDRGHHDMSHDGDSNTDTQNELTAIDRWYAEQLSTLLDHSVVLWCNELGKGNSHTYEDIPYVLAGSAGGALRTGRYLRYDAAPHGHLFVSIMNALGIAQDTFGGPEHCAGPLSGL